MYNNFYRLNTHVFRITPDYRSSYAHPDYAAAVALIADARTRGEGFAVLTGPPGTGKTNLIDELFVRLKATGIAVAKLSNTQVGAEELVRLLGFAFDLGAENASKAVLLGQLQRYLEERHIRGQSALLIVDEAQDLSVEALEELRLITNLTVGTEPLIQVLLVGQDRLWDKLCLPELEQLHQRIVADCALKPLRPKQTRRYIAYQLCRAGWSGAPEVSGSAVARIHDYSGGVPRRINRVMVQLLTFGADAQLQALDARHLDECFREFGEGQHRPLPPLPDPLGLNEPAETPSLRPIGKTMLAAMTALRVTPSAMRDESAPTQTAFARERWQSVDALIGNARSAQHPTDLNAGDRFGSPDLRKDRPSREAVTTPEPGSGRSPSGRRPVTRSRWMIVMAVGFTFGFLAWLLIELPEDPRGLVSYLDEALYSVLTDSQRPVSAKMPSAVASSHEPRTERPSGPTHTVRRTDSAVADTESVERRDPRKKVAQPAIQPPAERFASQERLPLVRQHPQAEELAAAGYAAELDQGLTVDQQVASVLALLQNQQPSEDSALTRVTASQDTLHGYYGRPIQGTRMPRTTEAGSVIANVSDTQMRDLVGETGVRRHDRSATADEVTPDTHAAVLLRTAQRALSDYRQTRLPTVSTHSYLREALAREPHNAIARAGLWAIRRNYQQLAQQKIGVGDLKAAEQLVRHGLKIAPNDSFLLSLADEVANRKQMIRTGEAAPIVRPAPRLVDFRP